MDRTLRLQSVEVAGSSPATPDWLMTERFKVDTN